MSLKCGIVGLPNVGKSTLFNALTAAGIEAQNFHFCGIFDHFTALLDNFTFASFLVVFSPTFSFLGQFYHIKCHFD